MGPKRKVAQKESDADTQLASTASSKRSKTSQKQPAGSTSKAAESKGERIAVLLRAINVGGGPNRVNMKELIKQLQDAGMTQVETYLQSGNVVFSTELPAVEAAQRVEEAVEEQGAQSTCMARTRAEVQDIIEHLPYDASDHTKVHVCFLTRELSKDAEKALTAVKCGEDAYHVHGAQLYLSLPNGAGRAALSGSAIERALNSFAIQTTTRNWRTVLRLGEMLQT